MTWLGEHGFFSGFGIFTLILLAGCISLCFWIAWRVMNDDGADKELDLGARVFGVLFLGTLLLLGGFWLTYD